MLAKPLFGITVQSYKEPTFYFVGCLRKGRSLSIDVCTYISSCGNQGSFRQKNKREAVKLPLYSLFTM
jgi:hypothetical protein